MEGIRTRKREAFWYEPTRKQESGSRVETGVAGLKPLPASNSIPSPSQRLLIKASFTATYSPEKRCHHRMRRCSSTTHAIRPLKLKIVPRVWIGLIECDVAPHKGGGGEVRTRATGGSGCGYTGSDYEGAGDAELHPGERTRSCRERGRLEGRALPPWGNFCCLSLFLKLYLFVIGEFWKVCGTGTMDGEVSMRMESWKPWKIIT